MSDDPSESMGEHDESHAPSGSVDGATAGVAANIGIDQNALLQGIAVALQRVAGAAPQGSTQRSVLKEVRKLGAKDFLGETGVDPSTAENWLISTMRFLDLAHCTVEEKFECAVALLQDQAYNWWTTVEATRREAKLDWDYFVTAFRKKYVGRLYMEARKREFINLVQGNMSVTEYESEFLRLSRYAKEMIANEADKCARFENGLDDNIAMMLVAHNFTKLEDLIEGAKKIEERRNRASNAMVDDKSAGKRAASFSSLPNTATKRARGPVDSSRPMPSRNQRADSGKSRHQSVSVSVASSGGSVKRQGAPECDFCHNYHRGECWRKTGACLKCGSKEHFAKDCPKHATYTPAPTQTPRSSPTVSRGRGSVRHGSSGGRSGFNSSKGSEARVAARTYAIRAKEDEDAPDVVTADDSVAGSKVKGKAIAD